jgi:uncharacterized protein
VSLARRIARADRGPERCKWKVKGLDPGSLHDVLGMRAAREPAREAGAVTLPGVPAQDYDPGVRRSEVIDFFSAHRDDLRRLGISSLLVFGSVARDQARPDSDVDLIAEFDRPIGYLGLARVEHELETLLGRSVDLATPGMIRQEFRDRIYAEAVRAA